MFCSIIELLGDNPDLNSDQVVTLLILMANAQRGVVEINHAILDKIEAVTRQHPTLCIRTLPNVTAIGHGKFRIANFGKYRRLEEDAAARSYFRRKQRQYRRGKK